ncbi:MAG: hypothetical protein ACRYFW_14855 [Janthinobacterium lividum]
MVKTDAVAEKALRNHALADAATMFELHGGAAIGVLTQRIHDPELSVDERRHCRLTRVEVERLDRARRNARNPNPLTVWKPPLFSWAGIAARLGLRQKERRRKRR